MSDQPTLPSSAPDPPGEPPRPRFTRSRQDRVIGGVCGGLGRALGIDPLVVRIAAVVLLVLGGITAILYIAALVLVPEDGAEPAARSTPSRLAIAVGVVILVIAGFAALDDLTFGFGWGWWIGPLIPLAVVAALLIAAGRQLLRDRGEDEAPWSRIVGVALLVLAGVLGTVALAFGSAWATAAGGGEAVAAIVIAIGALMVVAAFRGGWRWLAIPALALALPAGVVSAAGIDVDGGVGDRSYHPRTVANLQADGYRLGMGELTLDLRDLDWPRDRPVTIDLDIGVGAAYVLVPEDVCVRAQGDAGAGVIDVLGDRAEGLDVRHTAGVAPPPRTPSLVLDAEVGLGTVEVRHHRSEYSHGFSHDDPEDHISEELAAAGCGGTA